MLQLPLNAGLQSVQGRLDHDARPAQQQGDTCDGGCTDHSASEGHVISPTADGWPVCGVPLFEGSRVIGVQIYKSFPGGVHSSLVRALYAVYREMARKRVAVWPATCVHALCLEAGSVRSLVCAVDCSCQTQYFCGISQQFDA